MKTGKEWLDGFRKSFTEFMAKCYEELYDQLYFVAFENDGKLPELFSCHVCETFREAPKDVRDRAYELAGQTLVGRARLFKEYYTGHVGELRQDLTIYEKYDIYNSFSIWSSTTLITKALTEQQFSEETLLPFLGEALNWMVEYTLRSKQLKVKIYDLLIEALVSVEISREDFLSMPWDSRLDFGRRIWNYIAKKSRRIVYPNWPESMFS